MEYRITDSLKNVSKADLVFSLWSDFSSLFLRVKRRVRSRDSIVELQEFQEYLLRLYKELEK